MGYLLQHRLGRGGMGVVDLALDAAGRPVALKRLAVTGSAEELGRARARLRREVEALGAVRHDAIVPLLDVLDDGDDLVLVMPYLSGGSLADRVQRDGPLPTEAVLAVADRLLPALAAMHRQGIVHRDCKPANLLFDDEDRAHLTDLGVASLRDATGGLTDTGVVVGTPAFIAPEQARGEEPTTASDVFALGATLYFAATGHAVYGDTDGRTMLRRAAVGAVRVDLRRMDPRLARLLAPMLQPDPRRRPTAARLARGPEGTEPGASPPGRAPAPPGPSAPRHATVGRAARGTKAPPAPRVRREGSAPRRLRPSLIAVAFAAIVAAATGLVALRSTRTVVPTASAGELRGAVEPTTTTTCVPLAYQPCGQRAAPNTDGEQCLGVYVDLDDNQTNGCEASPDEIDGSPLGATLRANLVPADDTDSYPFHVEDSFSLTCDGEVTVTLDPPGQASMQLEVLEGATVIARATAHGGAPATIRIAEPRCGGDDASDLVARVRYATDSPRDAAAYALSRAGDF